MFLVILTIIIIIMFYYTTIYEGFDQFANEFIQVPGRLVDWLKNGLNSIDLGHALPAGIFPHLGPCPEGLNARDIGGTCWAGKDICDVELPVCTGGCNVGWDGCATRAPGWLGGGCIGGFKAQCSPISCTSGSVTNCPHVTRFITDRMTCGDKENVDGLCYDKCKPNYKRAPLAPYWCIPNSW